uniref:CBL-interacting serine/threonine-protein kinase 7-like n=1 Tax=Erigeron canadensis TaxID=72917 RepID=UPI001CB88E53|nr:CBL-interacting serine/threonine-protein kinase 7-like [Erigeron canadensis]
MAPPQSSPPPPTIKRNTSDGGTIILNKYQLTRLLGRGSFAKVYLGRSLTDDTTSVAVKVIEKPATADPSMEPRLVREVRAMRRLNHPNILKLHEVLATKSKIYLVMELAAGGELFTQLTRRGRMKEATGRFYFQQLVSALHFCHQNGVAHRDLKPQNLLLDKNGNLKISDFGFSALPESKKDGLLHTACGTPAFTAPEILRGKGYDGSQADAWSCGVILFNLLAGYLPFDDSNIPNMIRKIYQREVVYPDWIGKNPRAIIQKLLDPNPKTRMTIESLMRLSWFKKSLKMPNVVVEQLGEEDFGFLKSCKKTMNAFDIISMSSGLNLSGIFEEKLMKKERRFTTRAKLEEIKKLVAEVGERLGYRVKKSSSLLCKKINNKESVISSGGNNECCDYKDENNDDDMVGLVKGRVVVFAKVMEVVPELLLVEMTVVDGGGISEVEWDELKVGFQDIVLSWHSDVQ